MKTRVECRVEQKKSTHIHTWFMLGPTREKHDVLNVFENEKSRRFSIYSAENQGYHKNVNFFVSKMQAVLKCKKYAAKA